MTAKRAGASTHAASRPHGPDDRAAAAGFGSTRP
jgi:hypothetical protein